MTVKWADCHPVDKDTAAMMRYILKSCQEIKTNAVERISNGERKPGGPAGAAQRGIEAWLDDFVHEHPAVKDAPRYALRDALTKVWEDGIHKQMPYQKKEWNIFRVGTRVGWKQKKKVKEPVLSWEEYNAGKTNGPLSHPNTVTRNSSAALLFEKGILSFHWGRIFFKRKAMGQLSDLLVEKSWLQEELFGNIRHLEFLKVGETDPNKWQISFVFE